MMQKTICLLLIIYYLSDESFICQPIPSSKIKRIINYKTLEITMGDINNYNFSNLFTLKQDISSTISNGYRN